MSLRTTWVLMVVSILCCIGYFALLRHKYGNEKAEEAAKQVLRLEGQKPQEVTITREGQTVRLRCSAPDGCPLDGSARWSMEQPVPDLADTSTITTLLNAASNLSFLEKIDFDTDPDPKEFGFGAERPRLEIKTKEGSYGLELGGPTAVGPNVYLRATNEPRRVFIVASFFGQMLERDPFHWRNKRLFPDLEPESFSDISWRLGGPGMVAKKENGQWKLVEPLAAPANFVMIEGLVSTAVFAAAKADLPGFRAAGKPAGEIAFASFRLRLYPHTGAAKGKNELVGVVGERAYVLDATPFDRFRKAVLEYRERRLFAGLGSIQEMELAFPRENKKVTLKRDGKWVQAAGDGTEELSQGRLEALADALLNGEATAFLPASNPAARQLAARQADVEVSIPGGQRARFLVVERKVAVTEGKVGGEVAALSGPFLQALPIRLRDIYASTNKMAPEIPKTEQKKDEHGHDPHHHHAH